MPDGAIIKLDGIPKRLYGMQKEVGKALSET